MTLHEAIRTVLREMPNQTGSTQVVCQAIIEQGLYKQKSGEDPFAEQIFLRARRPAYEHLFEVIDRNTIHLKEDPGALLKDPMAHPDFHGQRGGPCPLCMADTVARKSRTTGELYFGCTRPKRSATGGCNFKGCRSH